MPKPPRLPAMKIPFYLALLSLAAVSSSQLRLSAQPAPAAAEAAAQVVVSAVKFGGARAGGDSWFETEVEVEARPGGRSVSGQFVDKVRVTLSLGLEVADEKGTKRMAFYRSSAEAIALEGGSKSSFRFYLPPEVVRRDKVRQDVKYYAVEIEAAGQPQPPVKASASSDFTSAESIKNFLSKVSSEAGPNEGVLIPQYLSPFAFDSQRRAPSFLRRESQR